MDTKTVFKKAFSGIRSAYSCPDHEASLKNVLERAEKMENNKNGSVRVSDIQYTEKTAKKRGIAPVIAGIAGAAAVIAAGIFGIGYLNSRGVEWTPLKEGASNNTGGSQPGVYTSVSSVQGAEKIDISELKGKIFKFSDRTISIDNASYDGSYVRVDFTQEITNTEDSGGFMLEPIDRYRLINSISTHIQTYERDSDNVAKAAFIMDVSLSQLGSCSFIPAVVRTDDVEHIPDLVVTVVRDHDELVRQQTEWDEDYGTVADGMILQRFWASTNVLEADFDLKLQHSQADIEVCAVAQDGTTYPLEGHCIDVYANRIGDIDRTRLKYYFISADPDIPSLARMKGFMVNGKMFDIVSEPEVLRTFIDENGEVAVDPDSMQITTAVYATPPEISGNEDADTAAITTAEIAETVEIPEE